jgi:acyl-CoA thioester hydrolase
LASTKCDFINQGYFNQKLSISTYISKIGSKSFQLEHEIRSEETNELIAKANAIIVYFDFTEQRSEIIPDFLRARLESHLETK